jgi:MFS family permease
MLIGGFAPIRATELGFSQAQVATLLLALPLGTLLFQLPLGWVSDRTDRRYVLIAAAAIVAAAGALASFAADVPFPLLVIIYLVWSGASDSIYSLSAAHANDRAEEGEHVMLASSMLLAWSVAGCVAPALGSIATELYGTYSVIQLAIAAAVAFALFVSWRVLRSPPAAAAPAAVVAPLTGQTPLPLAQPNLENAPAQ